MPKWFLVLTPFNYYYKNCLFLAYTLVIHITCTVYRIFFSSCTFSVKNKTFDSCIFGMERINYFYIDFNAKTCFAVRVIRITSTASERIKLVMRGSTVPVIENEVQFTNLYGDDEASLPKNSSSLVSRSSR